MLCRSYSRLFTFTVVQRQQLFRLHRFNFGIRQTVSETPIVFRSDESFSGPFVIAPPHGPKREEILYIVRIVFVILFRIVRIAIVRIVLVGHRILIVMQVGVRCILSVGIVFRTTVVKQQRLTVPIEPQVGILVFLVDPLIKILNDRNHRSVESPETEFGHFVPLGFHLLHGPENHIPFIPIAYGIGHIHNQHINPGIGQHREILTDHPVILTQEVAHFRFGIVIRPLRPQRMVCIQPSLRILLQNFGHIGRIRALQVGQSLRMPRNVENSDHTTLVIFNRSDLFIRGHRTAKCVGRHPRIRINVAILTRIRGCRFGPLRTRTSENRQDSAHPRRHEINTFSLHFR